MFISPSRRNYWTSMANKDYTLIIIVFFSLSKNLKLPRNLWKTRNSPEIVATNLLQWNYVRKQKANFLHFSAIKYFESSNEILAYIRSFSCLHKICKSSNISCEVNAGKYVNMATKLPPILRDLRDFADSRGNVDIRNMWKLVRWQLME